MSDSERLKPVDAARLAARSPEQFAALAESMAASGERDREPRWLLVLARQKDAPTPAQVAALADALKLDPFTARQRLIAPAARPILRLEREERAREWENWMAAARIEAFAVGEADLARHTHRRCTACWQAEGRLILEDDAGARHPVAPAEVCALVLGEVRESTAVETTYRDPMAGDIRSAKERTAARSELLLDVHLASTPAGFRIGQDSFKFHAVFPDRTGASAILMREVLAKLRKLAPQAAVFDNFAQAEAVLGGSFELIDSSSYLALNWLRPGLKHASVAAAKTYRQSNADAFEIYSTLARLETMRVRPA